ncbi:MAG TPA: NUDIX domain-containing protein [bacterium]|nr:NUDIX domain-containing protein [bacterium]
MTGQNIRLAVIFLVITEDSHGKKIIAIGKKRSNSPKFMAGCWHIPGGTSCLSDYLNLKSFAELIQRIAEREAKEELGVEVDFKKILHSQAIIKPDKGEFLQMVYVLCRPVDNSQINLKHGSDLEDAKWVPFNKVLEYLDVKAIEHLPDGIKLFITSFV